MLREFPKWIMNEEEYQNQTLEIDEVCDLTAMLLTTAQVSTWFVEFLIHLPIHQNSQVTYLDRIQGRNGTYKISKLKCSIVCTVLVVILVKNIFIVSILFYCLLFYHSFKTSPNTVTNLSKLFELRLLNAFVFF